MKIFDSIAKYIVSKRFDNDLDALLEFVAQKKVGDEWTNVVSAVTKTTELSKSYKSADLDDTQKVNYTKSVLLDLGSVLKGSLLNFAIEAAVMLIKNRASK